MVRSSSAVGTWAFLGFILLFLVMSEVPLGAAQLGLNATEKMTPNGAYIVEVFQGSQWLEAGRLYYDKYYRERGLELGRYITPGAPSRIRLSETGGGAAHIDSVLLGGIPPVGAEIIAPTAGEVPKRDILLRKVSKKDYDVIDAFGQTIELTFPQGEAAHLKLTARVEPPVISQMPFQYPVQNLYREMNGQARFYRYKMDSARGGLRVDGNIKEVSGEKPFFKEYARSGSGHPSGFTYGWVRNDRDNLYVAMDFTADDTYDGDKDYAKVYVKTAGGVKEFKVSVPETRWGLPAFMYTDTVAYEHKVYKFRIPFEELGITGKERPQELQMAFASYGTASPGDYSPKLAYDSANNRHLLVYQIVDASGNINIHGQLLDAAGAAYGTEFAITNFTGTWVESPVAAYDSVNNRFLVVWRDDHSGSADIYGQLVNADGTLYNGSFSICTEAGNQSRPSVTYDSVNHRFLVVWQDYRSDTDADIYGQLVNADGSLLNANFVISGVAGSDQLNPAAAYDRVNQRYLVVWQDYRSGPEADIYGQLVNASGSLLNSNIVISNGTAEQRNPGVACDSVNQRCLVVWEDNRSGDADIYGQLVNADGSLYSTAPDANFVISNPAGSSQDIPAVAYDSANQRYLVAWQDNRSGMGVDIYGQLVKADGSLYNTASRTNFVISNAVNDQVGPTVSYNATNNNFLAAFETTESGVRDLGDMLVGPRGPQALSGNGVTLITHGWNPSAGAPTWLASMRDDIAATYLGNEKNYATITVTKPAGSLVVTTSPWDFDLSTGNTGQVLVILDWTAVANHLTSGVTAQAVAAAVVDKIVTGQNGKASLAELPIHLIGHSRGGGLVLELARLLGEKGVVVDQVTPLDPHPLTAADPQVNPLSPIIDTPAAVYQNVVFADVYYQNFETPTGQYVAGAYNRLWGNLTGGFTSPQPYANHRDIYLLYQGTIKPENPVNNGEASMAAAERTAWFNAYESGGDFTGFYYSRLKGTGDRRSSDQPVAAGDAVKAGQHSNALFGGTGSRQALTWAAANWPNIAALDILHSGVPLGQGDQSVIVGTALDLRYVYLDYDSGCTVTLHADVDRNPYNNNDFGTIDSAQIHPATGAVYASNNIVWDTSGMSAGDELYVYAKVTDGVRTRYFYAPSHLVFEPIPTATLTANSTGNGSGTISSSTGGINYDYPASNTGITSPISYGTNVVLTATATADSAAAWTDCSGAPSGAGTGTATCTYANLDGNKTATATFTLMKPRVTTAPVSNITPTTASSGGEVTDIGSAAVTARGVCWNTSGTPTISDSHTTDGEGAGSFVSSLAGLSLNTTYFVRAYAVNSYGTSYGEERSFTAELPPPAGNALAFSGTNAYVRIEDADDLDMTSNYTLECWFKADSFGGLRGLITKYQDNGTNGYLLRLTGSDLDFDQLTTSGLNLEAGRWYHAAAVNSNGARHLYLDGVEQTLSGFSYTVQANSDPLCLGIDYLVDNSRYFAGQMDEARVWNVARSGAEIRDAMHRELTGSESGLVAYYRFNEGSGTALADITGKGHTGALQNGAVWAASTAPVPFYTAHLSDWNTPATWADGQGSPSTAWSRVELRHEVNVPAMTLTDLTLNCTGGIGLSGSVTANGKVTVTNGSLNISGPVLTLGSH